MIKLPEFIIHESEGIISKSHSVMVSGAKRSLWAVIYVDLGLSTTVRVRFHKGVEATEPAPETEFTTGVLDLDDILVFLLRFGEVLTSVLVKRIPLVSHIAIRVHRIVAVPGARVRSGYRCHQSKC